MAGHSKFKNIMHRKGAQDARRAKKFARLTKELQVAVRGGTDPSSNPRLRSALSACRAVNMPKDNIVEQTKGLIDFFTSSKIWIYSHNSKQKRLHL